MKKRKIIFLIVLLYLFSVVLGIISVIKPIPESLQGIAIVHIYGPIRVGDKASSWPGTLRGSDSIVKKLKELGDNKAVKVVILRINSPGGSVAAVQEIYTEVLKIREKGKKVVASMGDVAASGGYYIACAADKIMANPGTLTGSIGVIMMIENVEMLFTKIGIETNVIKSGQYKDIGSFARKMTEEEKGILQGIIDNAFGQFVYAIAKGRDIDKDEVLSLADGRIFTGEQAKENGLIDELGNKEDAIKLAAELAGIKKKPKIISSFESPLGNALQIMGNYKNPYSIFSNIFPEQKVRLEYMLK
ncbi:signal peptide peptidase SppA [bacterium]|nr:signal peptide peptidase SppA [bacterium]